MKEPHLRPGYVMAAYNAGLDSAGWLALTEDLLQLPGWMVPSRPTLRKKRILATG